MESCGCFMALGGYQVALYQRDRASSFVQTKRMATARMEVVRRRQRHLDSGVGEYLTRSGKTYSFLARNKSVAIVVTL